MVTSTEKSDKINVKQADDALMNLVIDSSEYEQLFMDEAGIDYNEPSNKKQDWWNRVTKSKNGGIGKGKRGPKRGKGGAGKRKRGPWKGKRGKATSARGKNAGAGGKGQKNVEKKMENILDKAEGVGLADAEREMETLLNNGGKGVTKINDVQEKSTTEKGRLPYWERRRSGIRGERLVNKNGKGAGAVNGRRNGANSQGHMTDWTAVS